MSEDTLPQGGTIAAVEDVEEAMRDVVDPELGINVVDLGLVSDFRINWVWLPPWGPDKITDEGREQLRSLGFNV